MEKELEKFRKKVKKLENQLEEKDTTIQELEEKSKSMKAAKKQVNRLLFMQDMTI